MNIGRALVLAAGLLILGVVAFVLFQGENAPAEKVAQEGTAHALEFGRAGDYGYLTFQYNGSGNVTLIALSGQPKANIIVLQKDFLGTERYYYFNQSIRALGQKGFSITEVEAIGEPQNSIIVIPSGAMPLELLERLDNLTSSNVIIYLGKRNLIFSDRLIQGDWLLNVSNFSRPHIMIFEKTLEEFYSEKNLSLFESIERNSWAEKNSGTFNYAGEGKKTIFITLNGSNWLRMLPLADSVQMANHSANITGIFDVFPWQRAQLTTVLNYSNGTAQFTVEKDGKILSTGELSRVRGEEAFFLAPDLQEPGDYLVRLSDQSGTIGAARVHVKALNISFSRSYGNLYEFSILLDGAPLESARTSVGLNHSGNSVSAEIRNGRMSVHALLIQGENVFVIPLFGKKHYVSYINNQEDVIAFYAKYLTLGAVVAGIFYAVARISRKPVYRIKIPESVQGSAVEVRLSPRDVISAIVEVEKRFGWKGVPVYAKEIGLGLKKFTEGMEINEGNIEAIMKKLEQNGLVKSHLGLYAIPEWGDAKANAAKRIVRDKLVENGVDFSEKPFGFECEDRQIVLEPAKATREAVAVFEDKDSIRSYLSSLDGKQRAKVEIKIRNGVLRLATLGELDEIL